MFEWTQGEGGGIPGARVAKQDFGDVKEIVINTTPEGIELIRNLVSTQEATGKKKGWIYFQIMRSPTAPQLSLGDWRYLAKILGYKEAWSYKAMEEARAVQLTIPGVEIEF